MRRTRTTVARCLAALAVTYLVGGAFAQGGLSAAENEEHGAYLADQEGRALYVYLPDEGQEASTCTGSCALARPPLEASENLEVSDELDEDLLGTIEREDDEQQVTYAGWPLYRYLQDREAGDIAGFGQGERWFLIAPDGSVVGTEDVEANAAPDVPEAEEDAETQVEAADVDELLRTGETVYARNCASCHGEEGDEALVSHAVRLAGNDRAVEDESGVIRQIVYGGGYMPAFGDQLSNHDVASVATFIRQSWGNDYDVVTESEVVEVREQFD